MKGPYDDEALSVKDTLDEAGPSPAEVDAVTHTFRMKSFNFLYHSVVELVINVLESLSTPLKI